MEISVVFTTPYSNVVPAAQGCDGHSPGIVELEADWCMMSRAESLAGRRMELHAADLLSRRRMVCRVVHAEFQVLESCTQQSMVR